MNHLLKEKWAFVIKKSNSLICITYFVQEIDFKFFIYNHDGIFFINIFLTAPLFSVRRYCSPPSLLGHMEQKSS